MPLTTADDQLYAWEMQLGLNLYNGGHTWFNLDTTSIDSMRHIVQYNSAAGYMAGDILSLLGKGVVTWPVPVIDTATLNGSGSGNQGDGRKSNTHGAVIAAQAAEAFSVYPNPSYGSMILTSTASGTFTVYTLLGQLLQNYEVKAGENEISLPANISSGVYIGEFKPVDNSSIKQVRIVYEP